MEIHPTTMTYRCTKKDGNICSVENSDGKKWKVKYVGGNVERVKAVTLENRNCTKCDGNGLCSIDIHVCDVSLIADAIEEYLRITPDNTATSSSNEEQKDTTGDDASNDEMEEDIATASPSPVSRNGGNENVEQASTPPQPSSRKKRRSNHLTLGDNDTPADCGSLLGELFSCIDQNHSDRAAMKKLIQSFTGVGSLIETNFLFQPYPVKFMISPSFSGGSPPTPPSRACPSVK